jgi:hypothetical protein
MKKIYKFLPLIALPAVILLFANSAGSPGGKSGSPGDSNATCTQCHSGTATTVSGWITSTIPAGGYTPGETYSITATGTHNGVVKFGFELTAETSTGAKTGTFAVTDAPRTQLVNQNKAITHRSGGTAPNGNSNSWSVNWTAPATDVGQIRFYAAYNAANGNGTNSGDVIYKSSLFVNAALPASLVSITPDHADQNQLVVITAVGQNTQWTGPSPVVKLRNSNNANEQFASSSVQVTNATLLNATFTIPSNATLGMYDFVVDNIVLPSCFLVTVINSIETNTIATSVVYPNPASNNLWIEAATASVFSLYDVTGKLLVQQQLEIGNTMLDISSYQSGLYIAVVENSKSRELSKLIIK